MSNCTIKGCNLEVRTNKMCRIRYQRWNKGDRGERLLRPIRKFYDPICSVTNCDNKHSSVGLCSTHIFRLKKTGSLRENYKIGEIPPTKKYLSCKIDGCTSTYKMNKGYCNAHYLRLRRHGDPLGGRNDEKHGEAHTRSYRVYRAMINRCYNPNIKGYKRYGGRGITVCKRWLDSYIAFKDDMGEKPTADHSIDRIDNDGNYEPSNCRWATKEQQMRNRGYVVKAKTPYTGVYKAGKKYAVECSGIYVGKYSTIEEAISARLMAESIYWQ